MNAAFYVYYVRNFITWIYLIKRADKEDTFLKLVWSCYISNVLLWIKVYIIQI